MPFGGSVREEAEGHHRKPIYWAMRSAAAKPDRFAIVPMSKEKPAAKVGERSGSEEADLRGDIQSGCADNVGCVGWFR